MAHISVSNHFKRHEEALSDAHSGCKGLHIQSTGHKPNLKLGKKKQTNKKAVYIIDKSMQLRSKRSLALR